MMNRTQPQGWWYWAGSAGPGTAAGLPRFCAIVLAGIVAVAGAGRAAVAAQSGGAGGANGNVQAYGSTAGIQNPTSPQACMRDLASRMSPANDTGLLLKGVDDRSAARAPATWPAPGTRVARDGTGATGSDRPVGTVPQTYSRFNSGPTVPLTSSNRSVGTVPRTYWGQSGGPIVPPVTVGRTVGVVPQTYRGINDGPVVPPVVANSNRGTAPAATCPASGGPAVPAASPAAASGAPAPSPGGPTVPSSTGSQPVGTDAQRIQELLRSGPVVSTPPATAPDNSSSTPAGPDVPVLNTVPMSVASRGPAGYSPASPAAPTLLITPGERVQLPPSILAASAEPVVLTPPGTPRAGSPRTGARGLPVASGGNGTSPAGSTPVATQTLMAHASGTTERALIAGSPGLTLWNEPQLAMRYAKKAPSPTAEEPPIPEPEGPWTLGGDLEKYRAHAVKEGSRNSGESLLKALERAGLTLGDGANVFVLGYASDRAKPFRKNDGKGLLEEPGKVPERAGATIGSLGYALYSVVDLATLNALPDPDQPAYQDNNPLVRPVLFAGRTVGGAWKTTEEVGNALTWGLFDNVTGCIGLVIEDIVELVKHAGEAVTNIARAPFHLAAGKKPHEGTDKALDWVLLVPLELASNAVEMKGFSNMEDYQRAFADKGVIGSMLEFGGSTYIVYRAIDELADRHKNDKPHESQNGDQPGGDTNPDTPTTPATDVNPDAWIIMDSDGNIMDWSYWYN